MTEEGSGTLLSSREGFIFLLSFCMEKRCFILFRVIEIDAFPIRSFPEMAAKLQRFSLYLGGSSYFFGLI